MSTRLHKDDLGVDLNVPGEQLAWYVSLNEDFLSVFSR
jgi:hypothetical protein